MTDDLNAKLNKLVADEAGLEEGDRSDKALAILKDIRDFCNNEILNEQELRRQKKLGKKK